jgi:hypothetical protein
MQKRKITKINKIKFQPFNNYKVKVKGLSWHKITYSRSNGGFWILCAKNGAWLKDLASSSSWF